MPFTLAHPALVLPIGKANNKLSMTAMVAGSMVPDFEFFFQMKEVENIGHHWYGIMLFDFPVAVVFCYIFHSMLKKPLVANLPRFYKSRLMGAASFNWVKYAKSHPIRIALSILVGVGTHFAWDAFTHADGEIVERWAALQSFVQFAGFKVPVFYLLQILFSAVGMVYVHIAIARMPEQGNAQMQLQHVQAEYWLLFIVVFLMIATIRLSAWPEYNSFWGVVMACMGSAAYAWVLSTLVFKKITAQKTEQP